MSMNQQFPPNGVARPLPFIRSDGDHPEFSAVDPSRCRAPRQNGCVLNRDRLVYLVGRSVARVTLSVIRPTKTDWTAVDSGTLQANVMPVHSSKPLPRMTRPDGGRLQLGRGPLSKSHQLCAVDLRRLTTKVLPPDRRNNPADSVPHLEGQLIGTNCELHSCNSGTRRSMKGL